MSFVVLCILDGFGEREDEKFNAVATATYWKKLKQKYSFTLLNASEASVGLPEGQMGNSEVGHMTMGLGRIIDQDLPRIQKAIKSGEFEKNDTFQTFVQKIKNGSNTCHLMGLLSPGGVHSHEEIFFYAAQKLAEQNIQVIIHPFLDGRDTPPKSALTSLKKLEPLFSNPLIKAGTLMGRFYAMDRDQRWDRTEKAYHAIVKGEGLHVKTFEEAVLTAYDNGVTDEFLKPYCIEGYKGIQINDGLFMVNFRADRVRQLLSSFVLNDFSSFQRESLSFSAVMGMSPYAENLTPHMLTLFPKIPVHQSLGEVISENGLKQLRLAETEKYAHVTYFFNGGREIIFPNEERIMVSSPKVSTYDLQPEMSAEEVTQKLLNAMQKKEHQLIVVNYANPDMVGHTGNQPAIIKAIETIDQTLKEIEEASIAHEWTVIITADHGNAEEMVDENGAPHTAHTCNKVPFLVISKKNKLSLKNEGGLFDIAPTILDILSLPKPKEMKGSSLINEM